MIFSLFKVKPIKNKILKIDIKKNSSKKFSQYVKEISKSDNSDLFDHSHKVLSKVHPAISESFGDISGAWWRQNLMILGDEFKKKTVGEILKTVQIFFKMSLKKYNYQTNIKNTYEALICNVAVTLKKNENLRKQLGLR